MSEVDDMLREMAEVFEDVAGVSITEEQRAMIQMRVMREFGGDRVYVQKGRGAFLLGPPDLGGSTIAVMQRYGVTARTVYRWKRRFGAGPRRY